MMGIFGGFLRGRCGSSLSGGVTVLCAASRTEFRVTACRQYWRGTRTSWGALAMPVQDVDAAIDPKVDRRTAWRHRPYARRSTAAASGSRSDYRGRSATQRTIVAAE